MIDQLLMIYNYPYSTAHDRLLALYFLEKRENIKNLSLNQIMNDIHLSKSTIIRFCCSLGSKNFTHFKHDFMQDYLSTQSVLLQEDLSSHMIQFINEFKMCIHEKRQLIVFGNMEDFYLFAVYFKRFYMKGILVKYYIDCSSEDIVEDQEDIAYLFISTSLSLKVFYDYAMKTNLMKTLFHRMNAIRLRSMTICIEQVLPITDIYYDFKSIYEFDNKREFIKIMNGLLASLE